MYVHCIVYTHTGTHAQHIYIQYTTCVYVGMVCSNTGTRTATAQPRCLHQPQAPWCPPGLLVQSLLYLLHCWVYSWQGAKFLFDEVSTETEFSPYGFTHLMTETLQTGFGSTHYKFHFSFPKAWFWTWTRQDLSTWWCYPRPCTARWQCHMSQHRKPFLHQNTGNDLAYATETATTQMSH